MNRAQATHIIDMMDAVGAIAGKLGAALVMQEHATDPARKKLFEKEIQKFTQMYDKRLQAIQEHLEAL